MFNRDILYIYIIAIIINYLILFKYQNFTNGHKLRFRNYCIIFFFKDLSVD